MAREIDILELASCVQVRLDDAENHEEPVQALGSALRSYFNQLLNTLPLHFELEQCEALPKITEALVRYYVELTIGFGLCIPGYRYLFSRKYTTKS